MGTNFYLRRREPVHEEFHIAKRSWGWVIHFQDSAENHGKIAEHERPMPSFHSARDIRALLESGEYDLADEYGEVWSGQDALDEFDELCAWNGGDKWQGKTPNPNYPYGDPPYRAILPGGYTDPDGYDFTPTEFA